MLYKKHLICEHSGLQIDLSSSHTADESLRWSNAWLFGSRLVLIFLYIVQYWPVLWLSNPMSSINQLLHLLQLYVVSYLSLCSSVKHCVMWSGVYFRHYQWALSSYIEKVTSLNVPTGNLMGPVAFKENPCDQQKEAAIKVSETVVGKSCKNVMQYNKQRYSL